MQMKCVLKVGRPLYVPFNYNYQVQSAIYAKLRGINESDFWHDDGFGAGKIYKAFVFGKLSGTHHVVDKHLVFTDEIALEIRSPLFEFIDILQRSFETAPQIKLFDTVLSLSRASLTNRHINASSALFASDSPVVVHETADDGKTIYYSPDSEEFFKRLEDNFYSKYKAVSGFPAEKIKISPSGSYKKIVTSYKGVWINAYMGRFLVKGNEKALEFIYNTGLGEKNSQGFGMMRL